MRKEYINFIGEFNHFCIKVILDEDGKIKPLRNINQKDIQSFLDENELDIRVKRIALKMISPEEAVQAEAYNLLNTRYGRIRELAQKSKEELAETKLYKKVLNSMETAVPIDDVENIREIFVEWADNKEDTKIKFLKALSGLDRESSHDFSDTIETLSEAEEGQKIYKALSIIVEIIEQKTQDQLGDQKINQAPSHAREHEAETSDDLKYWMVFAGKYVEFDNKQPFILDIIKENIENAVENPLSHKQLEQILNEALYNSVFVDNEETTNSEELKRIEELFSAEGLGEYGITINKSVHTSGEVMLSDNAGNQITTATTIFADDVPKTISRF